VRGPPPNKRLQLTARIGGVLPPGPAAARAEVRRTVGGRAILRRLTAGGS